MPLASIVLIRLGFGVLARGLQLSPQMTAAVTPAIGYSRMIGRSGMAVSLAAGVAAAGWLPVALSQTSTDPGLHSVTAATHQAGTSATCATCGVVEAVRVLEVRAEPPAGGDARKPAGTRTSYRVTVKMADGSYRTLAQSTPPAVGIGDRVRVADGAVVRDQ